MNTPDPAPVLDLVEAFRRSKTMFTALALGVFDRLHEASSPAAALAEAMGTHADATERLLEACAALGLLEKREGRYSNQPVAEAYLWSGSPRTLAGYIQYSERVLYPMWAHLDSAIREGTHRWGAAFGLEGPIFNHFFRTPEAQREFLRGMHGFGMLSSPPVVSAFDLSRFHTIADLGGGTGHLAMAACERYPALRGIVFDLPGPAAIAREHVALSPASERIQVVAGNFFEDDLPSADLYAMGRILHDWTEEKIAALLASIVRKLPPGGGLLVAEKLLHEDGVGPLAANMQSLNMLICTEGKERSLGDYARLLRQAGFVSVEGCRTRAPLDAVLALKG